MVDLGLGDAQTLPLAAGEALDRIEALTPACPA
jgi:hypothetical protein